MKKQSRPKTLKTLYQRANRAGGQLFSIQKMVRTNRPPEDILILLLAIERSVDALIYEHFEPLIREYLKNLLTQLSESENGAPEFRLFIAEMSKRHHEYGLEKLPKVFYRLKQYEHPHQD